MNPLLSLLSLARRPRRPAAASPEEARFRETFDSVDAVVVLAGDRFVSRGPAAAGQAVPSPPLRYRHFLIDEDVRLEQWRRSLDADRIREGIDPHPGHAALAKLARTRRIKVVTTAVDGLYDRAGLHPEDLAELDGRGDAAACPECGRRSPLAAHAADVAAGRSPTCGHDGAILKPAHAMFGETPPRSVLLRAEEWIRACDLLVVAGADPRRPQVAALVADASSVGARIAVLGDREGFAHLAPDHVVDGEPARIVAALAA